jgi:extradiol dioxygenase family protein
MLLRLKTLYQQERFVLISSAVKKGKQKALGPFRFFGWDLENIQFNEIKERLMVHKVEISIPSQIGYKGQLTMFILDTTGNPLEFKEFKSS